MDREEFLSKIKAAGTCEDEVERRTMLTEIYEESEHVLDHSSQVEADLNKIKEENETLRQANMKLFLKVGETKTPEERRKDETGLDDPEEPKRRKYEDLFDEKGMIK